MLKRSQRRISRTPRNDGCLWGLFRMFDFNQSCNSQRLLSNREYGYGRFAADERYPCDALDLLSDFAEMDTGAAIPCQDEAKMNTTDGHIRLITNEEISEVHQSEIGSVENKQISARLGHEDLTNNIDNGSSSQKVVSHLDSDDLAVSTSDSCSSCPIHCLTEKFCDGLQLATLLQEIQVEKNIDRELECRKNSHFGASVNTMSSELHSPGQPDVQVGHSSNFLWDFVDEVLQMEEVATSGALNQADDLLNSLKLLSSNKELLHQLLQDPNSKLIKHVKELKNCHAAEKLDIVSDKSYQESNVDNIPGKDKVSEVNGAKGPAKKIVVLKPIPSKMQSLSIVSTSITSLQSSQSKKVQVESRRATLDIFIRDLKRRLRSAIGEKKKDRKYRITSSDVQEGSSLPKCSPQENFATRNLCDAKHSNGIENQQEEQRKPCSVDIDLGRDNNKNQEKRTICILEREYNFQREAKRHLSEMLHSKIDIEHHEKQSSKSLQNILSLEDYKFSPVFSPSRHKETLPFHPQMRYSSLWSSSHQENSGRPNSVRYCTQIPDCSSNNSDTESHVSSLSIELKVGTQDGNSTKEVPKMEEAVDISESKSIETSEMACAVDEISAHNGHKVCGINEIQADDETQSSKLDLSVGTNSTNTSTPSSTLIHHMEVPEIMMEKLERPSPVSVLIPPFTDDATCSTSSPVSEQREDVGLPLSPRELHYGENDKSDEVLSTSCFQRVPNVVMGEEEFKAEYVKSLLDTSGLINIETWERRQPLLKLLDPSVFDEVEIPFGDIPYDPTLIFDCTDEILEGIREKYFPRKPWAVVKTGVHPFPCSESLIQEVCRRAACYNATQSQNSLNQVIRKDLDMTIWMDTSAEIDDMGAAIEDEILEEILEELMFAISDSVEPCR